MSESGRSEEVCGVVCTYCGEEFDVSADDVGQATNCWIVHCGHQIACPSCHRVYMSGRIMGMVVGLWAWQFEEDDG